VGDFGILTPYQYSTLLLAKTAPAERGEPSGRASSFRAGRGHCYAIPRLPPNGREYWSELLTMEKICRVIGPRGKGTKTKTVIAVYIV